jgi:large subunit ribosomal protein L6
MSRIGSVPVKIPGGVNVTLGGEAVGVKGPKGELSLRLNQTYVTVSQADGQVSVARKSDEKPAKATHGTTQRLIAQMVEGVTKGFSKELEIQGTGYRAETQGRKLVVKLGYSHDIHYDPPAGIQLQCPRGHAHCYLGH